MCLQIPHIYIYIYVYVYIHTYIDVHVRRHLLMPIHNSYKLQRVGVTCYAMPGMHDSIQ